VGKKKLIDIFMWILVFIVIVVNFFLLQRVKQNSIAGLPLKYLDIKKPTLIVLLDEFECVSCVRGLLFLNDMYITIKEEGNIDFLGIVLSKNKTDKKDLSKAFVFPVIISDDFMILKRLNINRSPIILGLSKDHRVVYYELVPFETPLTENHIRKGVLDRLYYSLSW